MYLALRRFNLLFIFWSFPGGIRIGHGATWCLVLVLEVEFSMRNGGSSVSGNLGGRHVCQSGMSFI
jgi:hypothetical protein